MKLNAGTRQLVRAMFGVFITFSISALVLCSVEEIPVEIPAETPVDIPAETPVDIPAKTPVEIPVDIPVTEGFGGDVKIQVEDDVLILTDDNFDVAVLPKHFIVVYFYAPWCGHCQSLGPEYAKAAGILQGENIPLAKMDATAHTKIAQRYDVQSYPTVLIFRKGKKEEYDGPRDSLGIVDYIKQKGDPNYKPPASVVLVLTADNFTNVIETSPLILVEFYAPWCGHCKALAPEYERAALELRKHRPIIPLAKVDGTAEKDLAEKLDIHGWPTLVIYRNGRKYEYHGPRKASGIVGYMKEQASLPSGQMSSVRQLEGSLSKIETAVVGFFNTDQDALYQEFIAACNQLRGRFTFRHTFEPDVTKHYGVHPGTISLFLPEIFQSKYEPSRRDYTQEEGNSSDIVKFIEEKSAPLVGHRTRTNLITTYSPRPLVVVYYDVDFSHNYRKATQLVRDKVVTVAKDFPEVRFAISRESEFEDELKDFGLEDSGEDINAGMFAASGYRYPMEPTEDFGSDELRDFVEKTLAGNSKPHLKSQPVPKKSNEAVRTLVATTFEKLVHKSGRDVLLELYAPWCGHCKALEPVYNEVANHFKDNKKILIAKMDATANDVMLKYPVSGYPTIYFIAAGGQGQPIPYNDKERTAETLIAFIEKHSSFITKTKDEL